MTFVPPKLVITGTWKETITMNKRNKILSAMFGLIVGLSLGMPMRALAENVRRTLAEYPHPGKLSAQRFLRV